MNLLITKVKKKKSYKRGKQSHKSEICPEDFHPPYSAVLLFSESVISLKIQFCYSTSISHWLKQIVYNIFSLQFSRFVWKKCIQSFKYLLPGFLDMPHTSFFPFNYHVHPTDLCSAIQCHVVSYIIHCTFPFTCSTL